MKQGHFQSGVGRNKSLARILSHRSLPLLLNPTLILATLCSFRFHLPLTENPTNLWCPGRSSRKAMTVTLACGLVFLTSIGGILPVLPGILGVSSAPDLAGSLTRVNAAGHTVTSEPPGVSLSAGTVSYGKKAQASMNQAVDSSITPHLVATKDAFIYQTSYGTYSFNRTSPHLFSLSSRSGTQLTKTGFFFINSTTTLTLGSSAVTSANDTEIQVRYSVLAGRTTVGNLFLDVVFQKSIAPKFTISFVKTPLSVPADYNIVWLTFTAQRWLKSSSSSIIDVQGSKTVTSIVNIVRADTGPEGDASNWREWLTTDWTDAGSGLLKVGYLSLGGYSGYGQVVVFGKNVARIDPTQVSSSTSSFATAYSTQRKTFYYGGYYFIFFYDGNNIVYESGQDGVHWSSTFPAASGPISTYSFDLYQSGMNLALGWLNYNPGAGGDGTTQLLFRKGLIVGSSISWIGVATVATWTQPYSSPLSVTITSDGLYWVGGIWNTSSTYNISIYKSSDGSNGSFSLSTRYATSSSTSRLEALQLIPMNRGQLMALSSHYNDQTIRWAIYQPATTTWASVQSFNLNLATSSNKWNTLAATITSDGFVHLVSQKYTGLYSLQYSYFNITNSQWMMGYPPSQGVGTPVYPSLTSDGLGNLHAFWTYINISGGTREFWYSLRPAGEPAGNWAGGASVPSLPFGTVKNATWISAIRFASKEISLVWTQPTASINKIFYGSIPLPSGVASSPPNRPWSRTGLSPYEQYFTQNGEYVSPGNGMLTLSQTDLAVPGRNGLSFSLTRMYIQPGSFMQGYPMGYETSPLLNLGYGWQINLPWFNDPNYNQGPMYLHFLNGELFPIVWNNVTQTVSNGHFNATYTMENHQSEDFVLVETELDNNVGTTTAKLTLKDGTVYHFYDSSGDMVPNTVTDRTGQNQLLILYGGPLNSVIDTVGRTAVFKYIPGGRLANVTYGGQTSYYTYSGNNLATVTDAVGRVTRFSYSSQNNWLLSGVVYSTGGNSSYTYGSATIGTDAVAYRVTRQNVYTPGSVTKSSSFSYNMTDGEIMYTGVTQSDGQNIQGYTNYLFNVPSSSMTRTVLNATLVQMLGQRFWYEPMTGRSIQQDTYSGTSLSPSFYSRQSYDLWGNIIYNRDNNGHESYQSFANTDTQWTLQGPGSLSTPTNGKQLYDDFNGPGINSTAWTTGGSASNQAFSVANSLFNMTAKATTFGSWSSMWARSTNTFSYPFYAEVQMALGQNPCSYCEAAELVISPQLTSSTGDPFNNNDALRVMLYDGVHYDVAKNVGGLQTNLLDTSAGGSWSVSWKIVLTDRNTLTVYLNRGWGGTGFVPVVATNTLGLSASFSPAYVYLVYRTTRANLYSASFDYLGLTSSNSVTVNGLQNGQQVQLYDWNNNLQGSATVPMGQSSIILDATQMVFPYGYFQVYEIDGKTIQSTSTTREIYGGSIYAYTAPFRSGGVTRSASGFTRSTSSPFVDDNLPSGSLAASDGGDAVFAWTPSSYAPVASGTYSHIGLNLPGFHRHYFQAATWPLYITSGSYLIQYIYIPSGSIPTEIMMEFHDTGNWEHRAYWGKDMITDRGTNGTASRRSMGPLPTLTNSWILLAVKVDEVGLTSGMSVDGWSYDLYDGGAYWDYSSLDSGTAVTLSVNNLIIGQRVELYDANGLLKTSGTVTSGNSVGINLYASGINWFPFRGYLKIYSTAGGLQYYGPLLGNTLGGDTYTYNRPIFSNNFNSGYSSSTIHRLLIGQAQYQNATATPEEAYSNFDVLGNLLKYSQIHNGNPLNTTYTYDIYGNQLSSVNPTGEIAYTRYSASFGSAYPTNVTRILGTNTPVTTLYSYNSTTGMTQSMIDARGNSTSIKYDVVNRVTLLNETASTGPSKLVTIVYNDAKNNYTLKNEKGNVTLVQVDQLGRSNSTRVYQTGNLQTLATQNTTYTWLDQAKTVTRPDGNRTTYSYDYSGRLVKTTNPDGTFKTTSYDDANLIQTNYDENNHRIDQLYDPMHRLIGVREYYGATNYYLTSYSYDGAGNLAKTVDAKGQITTYTHDDLNRLTLTVFPDSYNETRTYDNVGNLQTKKDPNGNTINYSYDTLNRLTTVTYPNSTTANYGYDKNNNRISLSYLGNSATFRYDAWNRLTNETWTISGSQYSMGYTYDRAGNLVGLTYPDNTKITYSVDPLNDVSTVKSGSTSLANVTYSAGNRIASISYGNGVRTTYSYDSRSRATRMKTTNSTAILMDLNYTYDATSNVVGINTETYTYDYLNRLTKSTGPWTTIQYGYDGVGNRLWMYQSSNTTYSYGSYDRLTSVSSSTDTYDNNGNLKTSGSGTYSYSYDLENRLTQIKQGSSLQGTYAYGPDGMRIQKTESGATTIYLNQGWNVIYEQQTSGGSTVADYVYDNGLLLGKISASTAYYFHADIVGSVRLVTKGSATSFSTNYQPFGSQYASSGSDPTYKYNGKSQDRATGLYYYGARYYDSSAGRFVSRDFYCRQSQSCAQTAPQQQNPYAYTGNNPETWRDASGLCGPTVCYTDWIGPPPPEYVANTSCGWSGCVVSFNKPAGDLVATIITWGGWSVTTLSAAIVTKMKIATGWASFAAWAIIGLTLATISQYDAWCSGSYWLGYSWGSGWDPNYGHFGVGFVINCNPVIRPFRW